MISVQEAQSFIHSFTNQNIVIKMATEDVTPGFVLAEDVLSLENVPNYRASIMDGYAFIGKVI